MRCSVTIRRRGRERPCERPAVVYAHINDQDWPKCQHHLTQECKRYAEREGIALIPVTA